jgi:hypothetical protein
MADLEKIEESVNSGYPYIHAYNRFDMGSSQSRIKLAGIIRDFEDSGDDSATLLRQLLVSAVTIEDIYELITPELVRHLRRNKPEKLIELLTSCTGNIYSSYDAYASDESMSPTTRTGLVNSVRIISRLAPFINEELVEDDFSLLLWADGSIPSSIEDVKPDSPGFSLLGAFIRVAFIRGFSIPLECKPPQSSVDPNRVDANIVWGRTGGIGGVPASRPGFQNVSQEMLDVRIEIVRLGITLLTGPLFQSMGEFKNRVPVLNNLTVSGDFIHTANFFVSLLLSVLDYDPSHYAIPIVSSVLASDDTSSAERLASSALTLLNVLIDPPSRGEEINVFREVIAGGFSDKEELATLVRALRTKTLGLFVANKALGVTQTYHLRNKDGYVLFLFNLLTLNSSAALLEEIKSQWGSELVLGMLALIVTHAADPAQVGLIHTCSFVLLKLSGDRDFVLDVCKRSYGNEINHALVGKIAKPYELGDSKIVDIIFLAFLRSQSGSESLSEMWYTILCNIAPLAGGGLTTPAASSLIGLLERLSRPAWLLKTPLRHHTVGFLLETVNNIIQYQYESSCNLVYQLVLRGGKILENLSSVSDELHVYHEEWRERDLINPISSLVKYLGPRIEEECAQKEGEIGDQEVISMIRKISLVGILPVPRPIVVRQFTMSEQTRLWFTSYLFGIVFVTLNTMPILDWQKIRMITLSTPGSADI